MHNGIWVHGKTGPGETATCRDPEAYGRGMLRIASSVSGESTDAFHRASGFFALAAALDRPGRFRKLVFAGYPLGIIDRVPLNLRLVGGIPGFGTLFKLMQSRTDEERLREFYAEEFNADLSTFPDRYFEAKHASLKLPGAIDSFASFIKSVAGLGGLSAQADLRDELAGLAVPSLFLCGENDLPPPEAGREAVAGVPGATFEVVDCAGHFPFHDAPDWTAERVTGFLRDDPDQGG